MASRITLATLAAEIEADRKANAAFQATVLAAIGALSPATPARVTPSKGKPRKARKAQPKADAPLPKGVRTVRTAGGTLSRKDWNRTVTCYAKTRTGKNSGAYKLIVANWDEVQGLRTSGTTPAEVLKYFGFEIS